LNGKQHRIGGPAVEFEKYVEYWIDNERFKEDEYKALFEDEVSKTTNSDVGDIKTDRQLQNQLGYDMIFTDEQRKIAQKIYTPDNQAIRLFCQLIYYLLWNKNPNPKKIRHLLDRLMDISGQDSDVFKYCNQLYNKQYCICGIRDCVERDQHILKINSRIICSSGSGYDDDYGIGHHRYM
jgi:hypothetical protein